MRDKEDNLLYIGKSKKLKSRVRSYFNSNAELTPRISLMVRQVFDIEFIVTDTEIEALTLESNLIKSHQPYFNVLLKDDKKYPYLCITWSEEYPRIFITRKRRKRNLKDRFYGPFVDVTSLRQTLFLVKKVFPLRQRPRPLYKDRTCLNYSINRCPGVCQKLISSSDYHQIIKKIAMIFDGRTEELKQILLKQMKIYSDQLNFEHAASIRDQLRSLAQVSQSQKVTLPDSTISRDVVAFASSKSICCIQLFQMRAGKLVGRIGYIYDSINLNSDVIIRKCLEEHYSYVDSVEIPPEILIQIDIPQLEYFQEWLSELGGKKIKIHKPKRSEKKDLIELVRKNAFLELNRISEGQSRQNEAIEDLAQALELNQLPRRIEGYDISHLQGSNAVGSQVVFVEGIPAKQHYRKYSIKSSSISSGHSDDYMALAEVIRRRFRRWSRFKSEGLDLSNIKNLKKSKLDPLLITDWPDLIMIDGGKGQLKAVVEALRELNLESDINVCSLAKKNEVVYVPGEKNFLDTDKDQIGIQLLRRVRDEAHRFALSYHRQKRSLSLKRSELIDIPGLGPKKIRLLLSHFHSVNAIQLATIDEISSISGFGNDTALSIWKYFHP